MSNSFLKMELENRIFQYGKYRLTYLLQEVLRIMTQCWLHFCDAFGRRKKQWFLPRCMECRRGFTMRILSVRLTVRLSVKRVHCDKRKEKSVQIFIPYERSFIVVLWEEEWLVGGDPFYLKFWVNRPRWSEIADFEPIIARSDSLIGSPVRAFQRA